MRPQPPPHLLGIDGALGAHAFAPASDLTAWLTDTFIVEGGPLENPDHAHLRNARIGCLWTNVANSRHGRTIVGMAELGKPAGSMGKWAKARAEQQVVEWFGAVPDFVLTFDASYAAAASDVEFCALAEHELLHCGQAVDEFGQPRFVKATGLPAFALKAHDVEEFVSVVRRYGMISPGVAALVDAARQAPEITPAHLAIACGTCSR